MDQIDDQTRGKGDQRQDEGGVHLAEQVKIDADIGAAIDGPGAGCDQPCLHGVGEQAEEQAQCAQDQWPDDHDERPLMRRGWRIGQLAHEGAEGHDAGRREHQRRRELVAKHTPCRCIQNVKIATLG